MSFLLSGKKPVLHGGFQPCFGALDEYRFCLCRPHAAQAKKESATVAALSLGD